VTADRRSRSLLVLALVNASMSSSLYLAILPPLSRELSFSPGEAGLLVTAAALAYAVAAPWWGRRSEQWGRVRVVTAGLLGYALASGAFAVLGALGLAGALHGGALYALLLLSRPLAGALAAAVPAASQAYLADTTAEEERTAGIALIGVANGLGAIIGPAVGGALVLLGLLAPLWVALVAALATAAAVRWRVAEPARQAAAPGTPPLRLTDPRPRSLLLALLALFTAIALLSATLGFLLQDRLALDAQATASRTGLSLAVIGLSLIVTQLAVVRRLKPSAGALLRGGLPLLIVGVVTLLLAGSLPQFLLACVLMGGGAALASSGAIAGATLRVEAHEQGALGGLTTAAQTLGFVIGPVLGGVLYQTGQLLPGLAAVALLTPAALWAWLHRWTPATPAPLVAAPDGGHE
jgi:MFS family permease